MPRDSAYASAHSTRTHRQVWFYLTHAEHTAWKAARAGTRHTTASHLAAMVKLLEGCEYIATHSDSPVAKALANKMADLGLRASVDTSALGGHPMVSGSADTVRHS